MSEFSNILSQILLFLSMYFEVFLLITFFENNQKKTGKENQMKESDLPSVTVVVPAFNEEKTITRTVESLLALDYPKEKLKIFLIDDGSKDNTWKIMKSFESYPQIRAYTKENGGKYTALNFGIKNSDTELIGCLDADSFVRPETLKRITARFIEKDVMAVVPSVKIHNPNNLIRHFQCNEYNLGVFNKKAMDYLGAINVTPGPFSFFKREVFNIIGTFKHAHNTEDMEIALRMQKNHLRITNAQDAIVYTVGPRNLKRLYKQRVRWFYGFLRNTIDYRDIMFKKKYKYLGTFFMPLSIIGFFASIYYTTKILFNISEKIYSKSVEFGTAGLSFDLSQIKLSWFFFSLDSVSLMGIILVISTIGMVIYGNYLSEKEVRFSWHVIYFPLLYPFISTLWLIKATYNVILSRKTHWR